MVSPRADLPFGLQNSWGRGAHALEVGPAPAAILNTPHARAGSSAMDAPALPALSPASPRLRALRRAVHVSFSLSLLYYLVPDPLPLVVLPKAHAALGLALLVTLAEALRLSRGWSLSLMRDYERRQPAAYYWLGLGCCLALVFFPPRFSVLPLLGAGFSDPAVS